MTLPAFLLSRADSRRFWLPLSRLRPAQNARYPWSLVFGLTIWWALLGVCVGLVLSLFAFQQLTGWLMWLFGSWGACAGLCWFNLTALCWNQRATRLRANPALATALPPVRFIFFRWMLGFAYWVLLAVVTPLAIMLTIENVRAELAWHRERARLVNQGERLEFRTILGPTIPADQNAGAAPVFAPFFDYQYLQPEDVLPGHYAVVWRDTNAIGHFEERLKLPDWHWPKEEEKDAPRTPKVNLAALAEAYRALTAAPSKDGPSWAAELKLPATPGDPTRDVLAGLSVANEPLAELCTISGRPRAQFPIHYDEGFEAQLRHYATLKSVSLALEVRCAARLSAGETQGAFEDAQCALRVSGLLREEPFLISQLVRLAQGNLAVATVWQGLAEHRWSDAQLAALQDQLAHTDYLPGLVLAFEGERAGGIQNMDQWATRGVKPGSFARRMLSILPRGMLRQNEITLVRYHTRMISNLRTAVSNASQSGLAAAAKATSAAADLEHLQGNHSPYNRLAAMLAPATGKAIDKTVRTQTIAQMAVVAFALERYHIKHGAFPEKLDNLVPAFLPAAPLDPMNNRIFHYRRTDDGWFQLYSVGLDGQDDGGVFKTTKGGPEKDWPWPVPSRAERWRLF